MKLIGYVRLSEGDKEEDQYNQLQQYCNLFNFELVDVVKAHEYRSLDGADAEARGNTIIGCITKKKADGIVMQRLDRFFPQNTDSLIVAIRLRQRGLTIHVIEDYINTATVSGWLSIALKAFISKYPLGDRSEADTNGPVSVLPEESAFPAPFGCVRFGSSLFRDSSVWLIREKIMHMYRKEGIRIEEIISHLQAQGIAAPSGGSLWHAADILGLLRYHDILGKLPLHRKYDSV